MPSSDLTSITNCLQDMAPITLEEMDAVKLMNRIDSKYVVNEETLLRMLEEAGRAGYRVLVSEGERISPYDSVYYDTAGLTMFYLHHNRRLVRQKVRTRCYVNSGDTFLEIKRKNNHGRTSKKRLEIPSGHLLDFACIPEACEYLSAHSWFRAPELSPSARTRFSRITLVNPALTERLTIDTRLFFENFRSGVDTTLQDAVIVELKQDGRADSQMKKILLALRVKPLRVSKYCMAVTLTDPTARAGRFKVKVRAIEKIIGKKLTSL